MSKSTRPRKATNTQRSGKSKFNKIEAVLVEVEVQGGTFQIPNSDTRCWLEWYPRADAAGPDRRLFYGKNGVTAPEKILGIDGVKLPRKGASCNPSGRTFLAFSPGTIKVWRENSRVTKTNKPEAAFSMPSHVRSQSIRDDTLMILAGRASPDVATATSARIGATPARR